MKDKNKGFSLIELIIVVIMVGTIVAMALTNYSSIIFIGGLGKAGSSRTKGSGWIKKTS